MNVLYNLILAQSEDDHAHGDGSIWEQAWEVITDPPHAMGEIFYALLFEVILVPITLLIYKKILKKRIVKNVHAEIDKEHGYHHYDGDVIKVEHNCCGSEAKIELLIDKNGDLVKVVETKKNK